MYDSDNPVEPKMSISLSLKDILPKTREAFNNKTLQMFKEGNFTPTYSGPCAIGVALTPEQAAYGDENEFHEYDVDSLVSLGIFKFDSDKEASDAAALQTAHDDALRPHPGEGKNRAFATFARILVDLEEIYL